MELAACQARAVALRSFAYSLTITIFEAEPTQKFVPVAQVPATLPAEMVYVPGGYTQIGSLSGLKQKRPRSGCW